MKYIDFKFWAQGQRFWGDGVRDKTIASSLVFKW